MLNYKNLEVIPGMDKVFDFTIEDDNFIPIDLSNVGTAYKFEVFDTNNKLVLTYINPTTGLGMISISMLAADTIGLTPRGIYRYRLTVIFQNSTNMYWEGLLNIAEPLFDISSTSANNITTLPDGTIYARAQLTVSYGTWYAIATYFRFLVSGNGALVIDGRDIHGTMWPNLSVITPNSVDVVEWVPDLTGMTAFRITSASGNCTVQYLP